MPLSSLGIKSHSCPILALKSPQRISAPFDKRVVIKSSRSLRISEPLTSDPLDEVFAGFMYELIKNISFGSLKNYLLSLQTITSGMTVLYC